MNNDLISREALKKIIDKITWYHINPYGELVDGALWNGEALYKVEDIFNAIDNAPAVEEKPFEINVFLENADESTLFDIKKQLAQILAERAEREAYAEARREAMRLDDNEDTYKWRGHA